MTEPLTLAQRLRAGVPTELGCSHPIWSDVAKADAIMGEAADELDRLTDANKALTAGHAAARENFHTMQHAANTLRIRATAAEADRDDWRKLHDAAQRVVSERNAALNVLSAELAEARAILSEIVIHLGDVQDGSGEIAPEIRRARSFLASKGASHAE